MKAAIRRNYCNPNELKIESVTTPIPKEDEVLIKIHATSINRTDCGVLTGLPYIFRLFIGVSSPRKIITGTDFSGEIIQTGSKINKFKVGDKVWGFNDEGNSSHAEFLCLKEKNNVELMPSNISFEEAPACLEGAHYAINFLNKIELKKGNSVLVNGAAGGIGTALIQLLKIEGVKITAVCETKDIPLIKSLGASDAIDYTLEQVMDSKEQHDFIFDMIGNYSFKDWKTLLKPKGIFISSELGPNNSFPFLALTTAFFSSKKVKFPMPLKIKRSMQIMKKHILDGNFKAVIDRTYPMDEISHAFAYVIKGFKTGNVIVKIS